MNEINLNVQLGILVRNKIPSPRNRMIGYYLKYVIKVPWGIGMNPDIAKSEIQNRLKDPPSGLYYAQPIGIDGKFMRKIWRKRFIF